MPLQAHPQLVDEPTIVRVAEGLSIALIGPDFGRRSAVARELSACTDSAVQEYRFYPVGQDQLQQLADAKFDAILIDLDSEIECALMLVENLCAISAATVMAYSASARTEILLGSMRAGAREFLTIPFPGSELADALVRAAARRPARAAVKTGKLLVFMGAKGGVGVTSMACNIGVALAQEAGRKTLLIDLDLPLGDMALNLGIIPEFSTVNALEERDRLDASLLLKLLVRHSSGVWVLAAPGKFPIYRPTPESVDKLLAVARQEFENVVVDVGSGLNLPDTALFTEATTIYLVTQAGIPELRNSNRLISQFFKAGGPKVEVILNRHEPFTLGVAEEHITKALTRPAEWKIPNDHANMRKMQINATPLVLGDSTVARLLKQIARSVNGDQETKPKKKFKLF